MWRFLMGLVMKKFLQVTVLLIGFSCSSTRQLVVEQHVQTLDNEVHYLRGRLDELSRQMAEQGQSGRAIVQQENQNVQDSAKTALQPNNLPDSSTVELVPRSNEQIVKRPEMSSPAVKATVGTRRCQAITKSGNQCSRKSNKGSPYCWQHQK